MADNNPLSPQALFEHVQDARYFHIPRGWFGDADGDGHLYLPQPLATPVEGTDHGHGPEYEAVIHPQVGIELIDRSIKPLDFVLTKFMVIELLVAVICVLLFGWLALKVRGGAPVRGRFANMLEAFLVFLRDEVVYATIGREKGQRYLPFLWTMFFFVLGCNLFGMLPWMGSPTGALAVTGIMALVTFGAVLYTGIKQFGVVGFLKAQVPHMDLPAPIAVVLVPLIFVIELFGMLVKHFVLAMRLLANMMAGHIMLAVFIGFIGAVSGILWWGVTPVSVAAAVTLSVLELFVAFLQAYIFVFLSALFIGAASHAH